jgi:hypothetical protein
MNRPGEHAVLVDEAQRCHFARGHLDAEAARVDLLQQVRTRD